MRDIIYLNAKRERVKKENAKIIIVRELSKSGKIKSERVEYIE